MNPEDEPNRSGAIKKVKTLKEIKARWQSQKRTAKPNDEEVFIEDDYEKADASLTTTRKRTGLCLDEKMTEHVCEWDPNYPECPQRFTCIVKRCEEMKIFEKCVILGYRPAPKEVILSMHSDLHYEKLEDMERLNLGQMELEASSYDAIYFNKATFECAKISTGCVISVLDNVCRGNIQNGMAIVRPPGHHAMHSEYNGYCYFNNVAIAAKRALDRNMAKKILIFDYDVHHGQGIQRFFYNDDRVLYFSIHRYEYGRFWPHLRESDLDYIGAEAGAGYNINVPLNAAGLKDIDYLAIVFHILLPVAYEFNPDLIIVAAGYDACIGCPEGEMRLTPGFYGHLMTLLGGLANGKIVVCLEGGYFLPSLAEGVVMTIRGLLDEPPAFLYTNGEINPRVAEVINSLKIVLHPYWKCFNVLPLYPAVDTDWSAFHKVDLLFDGVPFPPPYSTRYCYPVKNEVSLKEDTSYVKSLRREYSLIKPYRGVSYAYSRGMLRHKPDRPHPECPERLIKLFELFQKAKFERRCVGIPCTKANVRDLTAVHGEDYIQALLENRYEPKQSDIYLNTESLDSILTAAGALINTVDSVLRGHFKCGAAFIRPPGHHAERDEAKGFCFLSNVAIAAQYIIDNMLSEKVLIVDFDIHHGNGTQRAFYDSCNVLYISIHRYDHGKFYPNSEDANFDKIGSGHGVGYNVNIPFNDDKMNDIDYLYVFHQIVLPLAYSFTPDVILVSAGFDAGVKDPIGNYNVSPEAFGHFIQLLKPLANGNLILALEGGYNLNTVAYSMNMCIKALLGDALPRLDLNKHKLNQSTLATIDNVITFHKAKWPILAIQKKMLARTGDDLVESMQRLQVNPI